MAQFTIYNTLSAEQPVGHITRDGVDYYNAGAETGPYPVKTKFNEIEVPLPRTNLKVKLAPGADPAGTSADGSTLVVDTTDLIEIEFFKVLGNITDDNTTGESITIPGLVVKDTTA